MVQPINSQPLVRPSLTRNIQIREIKPGDPELAMMPPPSEVIESRFRQNAFCLGAFRKGEMIGYIWLGQKAYQEDEARCIYLVTPREEAVFDFDLYIFPKHRLGIAFVAIWDGTNRFLSDRGIRYTYSRLTRFNLVSRRSHQHLGGRRIGRAVFLKVWGVQLTAATVFPYLHLAPPASPGPRLT
ncbi:MAG: hypothetical protein R3310_13195, partial [Candidatus Competibacteraceae bacterium]|nr:hypothetical protein [Candidatus Competibacteraceae bacterium]